MAERIGSAYVRVYYKGDPGSLKKDLKNLEKDVAKEQAPLQKGGKALATSLWDGLDEEWTKRMRARFANNEDAWNNHIAKWKSNTGKILTDTERMMQKFDAAEKQHFSDIKKETGASIRTIGDQLMLSKELRQDIKDTQTRWERFRFAVEDAWKNMGKALKDLGPAIANAFLHPIDSVKSLAGWVGGLGESFKNLLTDLGPVSRVLGGLGGWLDKTGKKIDVLANGLSNTFGRRSGWAVAAANVFLRGPIEAIGKLFQGASKLFNLFSKEGTQALGDVEKAAQSAGSELEQAGSAASGAGEGMSGLGAAAAYAIPIIGVGIVAAAQVAASALWLLLGAATALASALGFALVGGVVAFGAALAPIVPVMGTVMLAMSSMKNNSGKLVGGFKQISDQFKAMGKIAAGEIFKPELFHNLAGVLKELTPLIKETAGWIGGLANSFMEAAQGPGGKAFINFLGRAIPQLLHGWTPILRNTAVFLGELFKAAIPLAKDFLGWLGGVTHALDEFGKGGKDSGLSHFLDKARQSMHALGDLIKNVGDDLLTIFGAKSAQKAGTDMLRGLADQAKKLGDWLKKAQKDGSMAKFFKDSEKFAQSLGKVVRLVGKIIKDLDSPEGRAGLKFLIWGFIKVLELVDWIVRLSTKMTHAYIVAWHAISHAAVASWDKIKSVWGAVSGWFSKRWHDVEHAASAAWNAIVTKVHQAWHAISGAVMTAANTIGNAIRGLGNRIQSIWNAAMNAIKTAMGNAASWVSGKISDIVNWFQGLPGRIGNVGGQIKDKITSGMSNLISDIVSMFTGLAGKILSAIGPINISSLLHGPAALLSKLHLASGGIVIGPTQALVGESGPEAVVPLNKPLSQVDPAVRALSAIAQGKGLGNVTSIDRGRKIDVGGITIITPVEDPRAVATSVVNRIAAASYI